MTEREAAQRAAMQHSKGQRIRISRAMRREKDGDGGELDHERFGFPYSSPCRIAYAVVAFHKEQPVRLRYELHGTGPTKVVLIMGLGQAYEAWKCQVDMFNELNARHREQHHGRDRFEVCVFDNRGAGLSSVPSGYTTTQTMANDAISLLTNVLRWRRVHVVGISMGGMISQRLAVTRPDIVQSLTLVNTHAGGRYAIAPFRASWLLLQLTINPPKDMDRMIDSMLELLYGKPVFRDKKRADELRAYHRYRTKTSLKPTTRGFTSQLLAVVSHYVTTSELRSLRKRRDNGRREPVPVLVCVGTADNLVRPENSKILARETNGKLVEFKDVGHALTMQVSEEFNRELLAHIDRHCKQDVPSGFFGSAVHQATTDKQQGQWAAESGQVVRGGTCVDDKEDEEQVEDDDNTRWGRAMSPTQTPRQLMSAAATPVTVVPPHRLPGYKRRYHQPGYHAYKVPRRLAKAASLFYVFTLLRAWSRLAARGALTPTRAMRVMAWPYRMFFKAYLH
eukprot:TRINITY_DN14115_c0_g1_i1.p1 TRINITY_DN14115_c0_g1~~TRINITY_DN14115_c0_g1_i1.p1  ORF type:complete len:527 (-),score=236.54 TRINITY_DN14115_c0_g1_i1:222-1742(-)